MKLKFTAALAATLFAVLLAQPAEARHHHYRHHYHHYRHHQYRGSFGDGAHIVSNPAGCPRIAFCGCGAAVEVFGKPIRELWLAANWLLFPRASPAPGMVAVRQHHVFVIREVHGDGTVLAYDANSGGHRTRIHNVSLRGYSVRNPHGGRYASLN